MPHHVMQTETLQATKTVDGRTLYAINYNGDRLTDDHSHAYTLFEEYRTHFEALGFTVEAEGLWRDGPFPVRYTIPKR